MIGFTELCAGIRKKQVKKLIIFSSYPTDFHKKAHNLLILRSKLSCQCYSIMCSGFPQKSEQTLFSIFRLCSDFCGKLLHIVEKHLDEWLLWIMRGYLHFTAWQSSRYMWKYYLFYYLFCPNTGTKFREPCHSNHVIPLLDFCLPSQWRSILTGRNLHLKGFLGSIHCGTDRGT